MRRYVMTVDGTRFSVIVEELAADRFRVSLGADEAYEVRVVEDEDLSQTAITPEIVPVRPALMAYHSQVGDQPPAAPPATKS